VYKYQNIPMPNHSSFIDLAEKICAIRSPISRKSSFSISENSDYDEEEDDEGEVEEVTVED